MILTTDRIAILWCILFCFQIIVVDIFVLIFFAFCLLYNVHLIYFKGLFNHQMTVFVKPLNDFRPHDSVSSWNVRFRPFRVSLISKMRSLQCEMFIYFYRKLSFFCLSVVYSLHFYYYTIIEFILVFLHVGRDDVKQMPMKSHLTGLVALVLVS